MLSPLRKNTNSGTTLAVDCEYPEFLSTLWGAFGPPRFAVYLPIPFLVEKLPEALTDGSFCDAAFARRTDGRELLPETELIEFERKLRVRHETAREKARAKLHDGGTLADAAKILDAAFRRNWADTAKLCACK